MKKAIIKLNGGNPVVLCSKCSKILKYYSQFTPKEKVLFKADKLPSMECETCTVKEDLPLHNAGSIWDNRMEEIRKKIEKKE